MGRETRPSSASCLSSWALCREARKRARNMACTGKVARVLGDVKLWSRWAPRLASVRRRGRERPSLSPDPPCLPVGVVLLSELHGCSCMAVVAVVCGLSPVGPVTVLAPLLPLALSGLACVYRLEYRWESRTRGTPTRDSCPTLGS